jgi:RNA polymerase I-specific transcription initiation factor RRN3
MRFINENYITALNSSLNNIILALMSIDLNLFEDYFVDTFIKFIKNLLSTHPIYLELYLRMIVELLLYSSSSEISRSDLYDILDNEMNLEKSHQMAHNLLRAISKLIPRTTIILEPLLFEYFPHMTTNIYEQEISTTNLLKITSYLSNLRHCILELIIGKITQIDV